MKLSEHKKILETIRSGQPQEHLANRCFALARQLKNALWADPKITSEASLLAAEFEATGQDMIEKTEV